MMVKIHRHNIKQEFKISSKTMIIIRTRRPVSTSGSNANARLYSLIWRSTLKSLSIFHPNRPRPIYLYVLSVRYLDRYGSELVHSFGYRFSTPIFGAGILWS